MDTRVVRDVVPIIHSHSTRIESELPSLLRITGMTSSQERNTTLSYRRGRCTRLILSGGSDRDGVEWPRRSSSATTVQHHGIRVAVRLHTRASLVDRIMWTLREIAPNVEKRVCTDVVGRRQRSRYVNAQRESKYSTRTIPREQVSSRVFSCCFESDRFLGARTSAANGNELDINHPSSDSRESWYETTREFSVERTCIPTIDRAALPTTASRRVHAPLTPSF